MTAASKLFQPIRLGNHILSHRVVLCPLTRLRNDKNGVPGTLSQEYYKQRATQGGLLITEGTAISRAAHGVLFSPGIYTHDQIDAWQRITDVVHAKGAVIFCQLWHVGRATSAKLLPDHNKPVAPSPIAIRGGQYDVPHELTVAEIHKMYEDFAKAAENAIKAGFNGIELHGANGYLIDE